MANTPLHIVGIGASAGGLAALEKFFAALPANAGLAYVVVQHLSPDFKSLMDDLLARHTAMPIHRAEEGLRLQADHIYLIPPQMLLTISDGCLHLTNRAVDRSLELPIDVFFESLARDVGARSAAVVLSGSGSDGARGVAAVHAVGGLVFAQTPDSAQFDGMPRSAAATGVCDAVLPPERIPPVLVACIQNPDRRAVLLRQEVAPFEDDERGDMFPVFALLRKSHGLDFSKYKSTTISRRVSRRMALQHCPDMSSYVARLEEEPAELEGLYHDLLIGVTAFFRDPESFRFLENSVLPDLFRGRAPKDAFRAWSPGCATGEEAYSLAILLREAADAAGFAGKITLFATDVHRRSIDAASAGVYGKESLGHLAPERLSAHFVSDTEGRLRVSPELRRLVVFAPHNVISDPPFTRIDLVCCRNLLIYLLPEVQNRVISTLHFALRTGGVMFLGPSEGVGSLSAEVENLHPKHKIYRKTREVRPALGLDVMGRPPDLLPRSGDLPHRPSIAIDRRLLHDYDVLLRAYVPAGVLVNEEFKAVHFFGDIAAYLRPSEGRADLDLLALLEGDLRVTVSSLLPRVRQTGQPAVSRAIPTRSGNDEVRVDVFVDPLHDRPGAAPHFFVRFQEAGSFAVPPALEGEAETLDTSLRSRLHDLENELASTKENLQATVEELQTSNEELQAANEELLASNEELQSTNEELHSLNEELYTVNAEFERKNEELRQLNRDLDSLLSSTSVGILFLDRELNARKFNGAIKDFFALLPQDVGRPIHHIAYLLEGHDAMMDDTRAVLADGACRQSEVSNGRGRWFLKRTLPFLTLDGVVEGIVITFTDITELKNAQVVSAKTNESLEARVRERTNQIGVANDMLRSEIRRREHVEGALRESEALTRQIMSHLPAAVLVFDAQGELIFSNPAAHRMMGDLPSNLLKANSASWEFLSEEGTALPLELSPIRRVYDERRGFEDLTVGLRRLGKEEVLWCHLDVFPDFHSGELSRVIAVLVDVTSHKESEARARTLAYYDSLTSLPNRELLRDRVAQSLAAAEREGGTLALLFVDLDNFKTINDSLGHHAGDILLQAVAGRLSAHVRGMDTVARYGGDEFVILLNDADRDGAAHVAEKILAAATEPYPLEGQSFVSTASIGISLFPQDGRDFNTLLRNADAAMYRAKARRLSTYEFFDSAMNASAVERMRLEQSLRQAVADRALRLVYQPQVDLKTGRWVSVEALVRWDHDDREMEPSLFIPIAEDCGMIHALGAHVIHEACRTAQRWRAEGLELSVAVNVSPLQFRNPKFLDSVHESLEETGLPPRLLEIEITENAMMNDNEATRGVLRTLSERGVRFAVDDFGTGYSSLGLLNRVPIHKLKIDKSFVLGLNANTENGAIIRSVIGMGHVLQLDVFAEGVETEAQLSLLRESGADGAQGYLFGRPMSSAEILRLAPRPTLQ